MKVGYGSPELLAVKPAGAVPTLMEDDGWLLTQAGAVLDYLAAKHPEANLTGGDSLREVAEAHRWSSFFTGDLHPAFFPVFMPYRYTTGGAAERDQVVEAGHALVRKQLTILNAHLAGKDWILGRRSVIDAYAFPMIRWAIARTPGGLADFPHVQALHDRLAADPAVRKVLENEAAA